MHLSNGPRHFNAKLVCLFQELCIPFLYERDDVFVFVQHGFDPPVENWFTVNAGGVHLGVQLTLPRLSLGHHRISENILTEALVSKLPVLCSEMWDKDWLEIVRTPLWVVHSSVRLATSGETNHFSASMSELMD